MRVIGSDGEQAGVMGIAAAIALAKDEGLDLVEVSPMADPPVCRIMDFGKYLFEQNKKNQSAKRKQKQVHVKEIKFRPGTDDGDYQVKLRNLVRFLEKLGEHEGGFTPFNFEITDRVREKDNFLVVQVDNRRRRDGVPTVNTDWWNYGGITRPVSLVEVPATYVADYFVQLRKGSRNEIAGWVRLAGSQLQQKLTAFDAAAIDLFGTSVAISGDTVENALPFVFVQGIKDLLADVDTKKRWHCDINVPT